MGVDRLAPRVRDTAIRFWRLYLGLTVLIAVGFLVAGMGPFDAVAHALSTASTGGFSTRDASIGYWDSVAVESVLMVALIVAAASFTLHSRSWNRKRITHFGDHEFRGFLSVLAICTLVVSTLLALDGMAPARALRTGLFNVVTLGTSGGFGNATGAGSDGDWVRWGAGPQMVLLFLLIFGGCTGSTAGGVKIMRLRVGMAHAARTLHSFRRPRALLPVRQGTATLPDSLVDRVAGFMVVYGMLVVGGTVLVAALGVDLVTAVSGVIGSLGNMGPALGDAGPTASFVDGFSNSGSLGASPPDAGRTLGDLPHAVDAGGALPVVPGSCPGDEAPRPLAGQQLHQQGLQVARVGAAAGFPGAMHSQLGTAQVAGPASGRGRCDRPNSRATGQISPADKGLQGDPGPLSGQAYHSGSLGVRGVTLRGVELQDGTTIQVDWMLGVVPVDVVGMCGVGPVDREDQRP